MASKIWIQETKNDNDTHQRKPFKASKSFDAHLNSRAKIYVIAQPKTNGRMCGFIYDTSTVISTFHAELFCGR
jgi:hypothetical protein